MTGNSSIPYEEGTEREDPANSRRAHPRVTAAFPMKRELKGERQSKELMATAA